MSSNPSFRRERRPRRALPWTTATGLLLVAVASAAEPASYTAQRTSMPLERMFDGTVEAVHQSTVSAETSARVLELMFDVNDKVPAGAVILRLVSTEQQQGLNQAQAALAEANANLDVQQLNYDRNRELLQRELISRAVFDQSTAQLNTAKARVANAEAALKTARQRLSYTEIRAPYGGVVSARHVEVGEAVNPGTPLMSGFEPNAMRVVVDIPHAVAQQVRELQRARVIADGGQDIAPGHIVLFPVADPSTSTVRVRLELPVEPTDLHPGQFIKVAFTIGETQRLLVPSAAVVHRSEVTGLYVEGSKGVQLRQVRLGNAFGDQVEVLAGLDEGEQIALDPVAAGISARQARALSQE